MERADQLERGRNAYARQAWGKRSPSSRSRIGSHRSSHQTSSSWRWPPTCSADSATAMTWRPVPITKYLRLGDVPRAARCALWLGMSLLKQGEMARGGRVARPSPAAAR